MWFAISEAGMDPVSRLTNTLLAGGRGRSGVEVGLAWWRNVQRPPHAQLVMGSGLVGVAC